MSYIESVCIILDPPQNFPLYHQAQLELNSWGLWEVLTLVPVVPSLPKETFPSENSPAHLKYQDVTINIHLRIFCAIFSNLSFPSSQAGMIKYKQQDYSHCCVSSFTKKKTKNNKICILIYSNILTTWTESKHLSTITVLFDDNKNLFCH